MLTVSRDKAVRVSWCVDCVRDKAVRVSWCVDCARHKAVRVSWCVDCARDKAVRVSWCVVGQQNAPAAAPAFGGPSSFAAPSFAAPPPGGNMFSLGSAAPTNRPRAMARTSRRRATRR